jgi:hypothetical protein
MDCVFVGLEMRANSRNFVKIVLRPTKQLQREGKQTKIPVTAFGPGGDIAPRSERTSVRCAYQNARIGLPEWQHGQFATIVCREILGVGTADEPPVSEDDDGATEQLHLGCLKTR